MLSFTTHHLLAESVSLRCGLRGTWSCDVNVLTSRPQRVSLHEARPDGGYDAQLPRRQRFGRVYELAVRMRRPQNSFSHTRVVTILPRYVLINHCAPPPASPPRLLPSGAEPRPNPLDRPTIDTPQLPTRARSSLVASRSAGLPPPPPAAHAHAPAPPLPCHAMPHRTECPMPNAGRRMPNAGTAHVNLEVTQSGMEKEGAGRLAPGDCWVHLPTQQQDKKTPTPIVWHWPNGKLQRRMLRLRVAGGGWLPSSGIDLGGSPGECMVKCRPAPPPPDDEEEGATAADTSSSPDAAWPTSPTSLATSPTPPATPTARLGPQRPPQQLPPSPHLFSVEQEEHDGVRFVKIYRGRRDEMLYLLKNELDAPLSIAQVGSLAALACQCRHAAVRGVRACVCMRPIVPAPLVGRWVHRTRTSGARCARLRTRGITHAASAG